MASVGVISVSLFPPTNATGPAVAASLPADSAAANTKPVRKPRSTGNNAQATTSQPWSSSRCFRLLRPFTSKIAALKAFLQSTPSAVTSSSSSVSTGNPIASIPSAEALLALVAASATGIGAGAGARRPTGELRGGASEYRNGVRVDEEYRPQNDINNGARRRAVARAPARTYGSGAGALLRTNSSSGAAEVSTAGSAGTAGRAISGNVSNSNTHLMVQKSIINNTLFGLYSAIYQCLAQLLQITAPKAPNSAPHPLPETPTPITGAPSFVTIATHAIANCILATSPAENPNSTLLNYNQTNRDQKSSEKQQEFLQSDWYDALQNIWPSYLPGLLRFHAIEVVAQSIRTRGIDCNLGSLLAGLCYEMGAMQEGDVIVRELLQFDERRGVSCVYIYLLSANNPGLIARGWNILKEHSSLILPEVGIEVLSNLLGGAHNKYLREKAWKDWMHGGIGEAREFVCETMRIAFGVWGAAMRDDVKMKMCRLDNLRRNGGSINSERAATGVSVVAVRKIRKLVYGNNILNKTPAKRIQDVVLEFLDVVAKTALGLDPEMGYARVEEAKQILWDLVQGFLAQSGEVRNVIEVVWGRGEIGGGRLKENGLYPKDAKVLVLLFVLVGLEGEENEDKREQVSKEIARVLDEERYAAIAAAKLAAKNSISTDPGAVSIVQPADDTFVEKIVDHLLDFYSSMGISSELGHKGVEKQVEVLMQIAFPPIPPPALKTFVGPSSATIDPANPVPKTPVKKVTWTPTVNTLSPEDETTSIRYYHSRLALLLATRFSSLPETKYSEYWVNWVEEIEKKVLCMPIPTPARKPDHYRRRKAPGSAKKSARKPKDGSLGWKFEEGLGAWIARTGATPAKSGALGNGALGGAVRRSSRFGFTSEGGDSVGGRRWIFGGVVLSPINLGSKDEYESVFDTDSDEEESGEESDEAVGLAEREYEYLNFDDVEKDGTDYDSRPTPMIVIKKRPSKYVHPTSASSLSSEGEDNSGAEPLPLNPSPTSTTSPLLPHASTRTKHLKHQTTSTHTELQILRRTTRNQKQCRRQSSRVAALPPKQYVVDESSSPDENEDSYFMRGEDTFDTSLSMLSSPPPEEGVIKKLRPRRVSGERMSFLDVIEDDSPVHTTVGSSEKKRKVEVFDTPATDRKLRKRARLRYEEGDMDGVSLAATDIQQDGDPAIANPSKGKKRARVPYEAEEIAEKSSSEADDENDKDFCVWSASKKRKVSGGSAATAQSSPRRARRLSNESTAAPKDKLAIGHGDVFLDGNKWELQARSAKTAKGSARGVYSSPPESTKSDDEDVQKDDSSSEEEKHDPRDEEFTLNSPPDSQTRNAVRRKRVQTRSTRSPQEVANTGRVQKRSSRTGSGKAGGSGAETGRVTRNRRSVSVKNYAELPDEEELSEDELAT